MHLRVEAPEPVTLVGLKMHVRPAGETELARWTTPAKPLTLVRVTVDVPELPISTVNDNGLVAMWKSERLGGRVSGPSGGGRQLPSAFVTLSTLSDWVA